MKLNEAIEIIIEEFPNKMIKFDEEVNTDFRGKEYRELTVVSGGESRVEHYMGLLRESYFGYRYWESTHRGGCEVYHIPVEDLDSDNDWLVLVTPVLVTSLVGSFHLMEGKKVCYRKNIQYFYGSSDSDEVQFMLKDSLEEIVAKYGIEALEGLDNVSASSFHNQGVVSVDLKFDKNI